jgi:hypothetical protein
MSQAPDPRIRALRRFAISITAFSVVGYAWLGFEQAALTAIEAVLAAYACELGLEALQAWAQGRPPRFAGSVRTLVEFLLPAHITGLACAMLLYGNARPLPTLFAVTVAIASKYLIQLRVGGRPRHVLNPSNLGITVTLLLFHWVGIAPPYEFTERVRGPLDWIVPLAILASGTLLNAKLTRKMPLILAWVAGFALQAVIRSALGDVQLVAALLPLTGTAFILYTNYMITDPGTSPFLPARQVAFGLATAAVYGLLVANHVVFGLFFSLTIVCCARGLAIAAGNAWRARTPARRPAPPAEVGAKLEPALAGGDQTPAAERRR